MKTIIYGLLKKDVGHQIQKMTRKNACDEEGPGQKLKEDEAEDLVKLKSESRRLNIPLFLSLAFFFWYYCNASCMDCMKSKV